MEFRQASEIVDLCILSEHRASSDDPRRIAVTAVMNRNFVASETEVDPAGTRAMLADAPQ